MLSELSLGIEPALLVRSPEQLRVIVRIDGVDVSHTDGQDGPGPWDVLVPVNRFAATDHVTTATVACCPSCGPDCSAIEARVRREGGLVRWELRDRRGVRQVGESRTVVFDAAAYDAEVARLEVDRGWEKAMHRAGRLILADLALPPGIEGVRVGVIGTGELEVWLEEPDEYQIWVHAPWDPQRPDESAAVVRAMLAGPAAEWPAQWHNIDAGCEDPPAYAGPSWRRAQW
ncbi:hypothetical protein ACFO1B_51720 [Dactylosporangium siamense]|uniref:Uncharacterized protein n=1 Tax=Dactylosporangium siamense TaxID=685454 RepID=A0A919U6P8_9ACTN|nr:hypothetical protein [Dactylosporangium siamense]GIG43707.1 hypothetical protein Dsi01nite_017480 [Dactylosporangium siamense]